MKKIMKKLRSRRGESLVEVLCAILIFTMSSVAMYSMVMAANNINAAAKEAEQQNRVEMAVAEKAEGTGVSGTVTMTVLDSSGDAMKDAGGNSISCAVGVEIYGTGVTSSGVSEGLYAYFKAGGGS